MWTPLSVISLTTCSMAIRWKTFIKTTTAYLLLLRKQMDDTQGLAQTSAQVRVQLVEYLKQNWQMFLSFSATVLVFLADSRCSWFGTGIVWRLHGTNGKRKKRRNNAERHVNGLQQASCCWHRQILSSSTRMSVEFMSTREILFAVDSFLPTMKQTAITSVYCWIPTGKRLFWQPWLPVPLELVREMQLISWPQQ